MGSFPAIGQELELFESVLRSQFRSQRSIASKLDGISLSVVASGGKRLRPAMMIASAKLGNYVRDRVLAAAVSIELLHTATLVHDDIIDNAPLRRNVPTVYASEGVGTAVFTGDYIFVKSILSLAEAGLPVEYMRRVAQAVGEVCLGEVEQYYGRGTIPGFKSYLSRISRKTGALFAAACAIGAHLGGLEEADVRRAARFGGYFGIAFQIMDDIMDIVQNAKAIGKPVGNDLKEGTVTLPVLLAAAKDEETRKLVVEFLKQGVSARARRHGTIIARAVKTGALDDSRSILARYLAKAERQLEKLPESAGRRALAEIMRATFRDYIGQADIKAERAY